MKSRPSAHRTLSSDFRPKKVARPRPELGMGAEERPILQRLETGWTEPGPAHESFLDYWNVLLARRKTLLLFSAAGLVAAILIGLAQTPLYRTRTSLEVQNFN